MKNIILAIALVFAFSTASSATEIDSATHANLQKVALTRMIKDVESEIESVKASPIKRYSVPKRGDFFRDVSKDEYLKLLRKDLKRYRKELASL